MPTRQRARKRALIQDDDSSGRTDALRSLLSQPRLHVKNLNGIVRSLEREPDLLSAPKDELAAVSAGYFESVRQRKQVLLRNGTFFEWVFADPNLLLQRTLRECPNLAELYAQKLTERPCDVDNPWSLIVVFDSLLAYDDAKHDFQAHGVNTPDAADFFREMSYSYWRVHRVLSWNYQTRKLPRLVGSSMADVSIDRQQQHDRPPWLQGRALHQAAVSAAARQ